MRVREQATKTVFPDNKPSMLQLLGVRSTARENDRGARNYYAYAERSEELPSTDPEGLLGLLSAHRVLLSGGWGTSGPPAPAASHPRVGVCPVAACTTSR